MKIKPVVAVTIFLLLSAGVARAQTAAKATDARKAEKVQLLKNGRAAYYSLKVEGMQGFTCAVAPDWVALLKTQGISDETVLTRAKQILEGIHFTVKVDEKGDAAVTHTEVPAENQNMAEGLKQIYGGMEQMTTGFFQTWAVFVVNPPLPEPETEIEVTAKDDLQRITYKEDKTDVEVMMARDYSVSSVRAVTQDFDSVLRPRFGASGKGFLLSGYDAEYVGSGGKDKTILKVSMEHQDVSGLKVPALLNLDGSYNGSPFQVIVKFSNCTATKKSAAN